jgi:hypothetical protein
MQSTHFLILCAVLAPETVPPYSAVVPPQTTESFGFAETPFFAHMLVRVDGGGSGYSPTKVWQPINPQDDRNTLFINTHDTARLISPPSLQ